MRNCEHGCRLTTKIPNPSVIPFLTNCCNVNVLNHIIKIVMKEQMECLIHMLIQRNPWMEVFHDG